MHCISDKKSIGSFLTEKNIIQDSPTYQRESGVWSQDKKQLFLDSIFNRYDVPKIYLHDLRDSDPRFEYAVIDGKQRLTTIWEFLDNSLHLADDFAVKDPPRGQSSPPAGCKFRELSTFWQEFFKNRPFDVVFVQNADEEDIEELFSRLNNGEPLNAAEKRNAMGGHMCVLIRDIAGKQFFKKRLSFSNTRYQHLEVAAKFLLIEQTEASGGNPFCDLKKRFLDTLVKTYRTINQAHQRNLAERVDKGLRLLSRVFGTRDPLLNKQAYPPMYYLFVKTMVREYAHRQLFGRLKAFVAEFAVKRQQNLQLAEDQREPALTEFGRLMQQGTNDKASIENRVSILRRYFLQKYPDTPLRDAARGFSPEERLALYYLSGKMCQGCNTPFHSIDDLHADHERQWAHGGPTTLANGRALCATCNQAIATGVA